MSNTITYKITNRRGEFYLGCPSPSSKRFLSLSSLLSLSLSLQATAASGRALEKRVLFHFNVAFFIFSKFIFNLICFYHIKELFYLILYIIYVRKIMCKNLKILIDLPNKKEIYLLKINNKQPVYIYWSNGN